MVKKIKILFTIGNFATGGKERQLAEIIKHIPKDKYEIYLFAKSFNNQYFDSLNKYVKSSKVLNKKIFSIVDVISFTQYIKIVKPDIVFSFAFSTSYIALISKFFTNIKFKIVNAAIRDAPVIMSIVKKIHKFSLYFYKYVVSNSNAGLKSYNQINKKFRFILPNGFDFDRLPNIKKEQARLEFNIDTKYFVVTMVASLDKRKDHFTVLYAAKEMRDKFPDIHFYLAGIGYNYDILKEFVSKEKLINVHFLGLVNNVEKLYIASDIGILISTSEYGEGFPNAIIEAMAAKLPVIATDNPGNKELITDELNGYIIKNKSPEELVDKIIYLYNNKNIADLVGTEGLNIIRNNYSIEKSVKIFENIINEVLKKLI